MPRKALVVLSVSLLLGAVCGHAQIMRPFKAIGAFTGEVPSAFSHMAPVSLVRANVVGRKIVAAQVTLQNQAYLSSAALFSRVKGGLTLPIHEVSSLESKFAQLDLAAHTAANQQVGYVGALRNTAPAVADKTLADPQVKQMAQLLDVQHYMQLHEGIFPHLFSIAQKGWIVATDCLTSAEGNRAFLYVVELLVKEQLGEAVPAVIEQLTTLHSLARNAVSVEQVAQQLQNWRVAANDPMGAPKLPTDMSGVSLRANAENLWLATEIRLLQLTPDIELPEILRTAQVTR